MPAEIGRRRTANTGPVSIPASICISEMPVSTSPLASAHWIGAAPR
jgi:hypothetical protein